MSAPEPLLVESVRDLKPGRALELACGFGRNAIWLADRGWHVTAVDISSDAIDAIRADGRIDARVADLERGEFIIAPQSWDLIVISRYLQRDLFEPAKRGVVPGGMIFALVLLGEGRFRADRGELRSYFEDWDILRYDEGAVAEIAARKPGTHFPEVLRTEYQRTEL